MARINGKCVSLCALCEHGGECLEPNMTLNLHTGERKIIIPDVETSKPIINHPAHYGGDTPYEAIKVIEAWKLGFCLGNALKYISRAGKKDADKEVEDLEKAVWYLNRHIQKLKNKTP